MYRTVLLDHEELLSWAESRKTSTEVAFGIMCLAETLEEAQRIWEDPRDVETGAVMSRAWAVVNKETGPDLRKEALWWGEEQFTREEG